MIILALDLGVIAGYAVGRAGERPRSGSVRLKEPGDDREVAFGNLIAWLQQKIRETRPKLIVKEAPLTPRAFSAVGNSTATVNSQLGLHAIAEALAVRYGIGFVDVPAATVRKHFIGQANCGTREKTKAEVVRRCHLLKLMPPHVDDNNQADALAIHDWACATYGRGLVASGELHLFGERA